MTASASTSMSPKRLSELPTYKSVSSTRLKALYSDISRQKASNPASFASNVDWWKRTLLDLVANALQSDSNDALILNASQSLPESLRYEGAGRPLGLAAVVAELQQSRALIPIESFLSSATSIYYPGSLAYRVASTVIGKPLWWTLQQLSIVDSDSHEPSPTSWKNVQGRYVVVSLLENAADALIERRSFHVAISRADSLYTFESFRKELGPVGALLPNISLSDVDLKVLIKFLSRDKRVLVTDGEVIKFINTDGTESKEIITNVDKEILKLKIIVTSTEEEVHEIQRRIEDRTLKISDCLRRKQKDGALMHLKLKKQLEESLNHRSSALLNLQSVLQQVEQATQNIDLMQTYESSTATLRTLLSHPSLQRDNVDKVLEDLATAQADHREIDDAIRTGGEIALEESGAIDESALAAELADLVAEAEEEERGKAREREEQLVKDAASALPVVPSDAPAARVSEYESIPRPELVPLPPSSANIVGSVVGEEQRALSKEGELVGNS